MMKDTVFPDESVRRLTALPWAALEGISAPIQGAIAAHLRGGDSAAKVLGATLRANRHWSNAQRHAAAEAIFGVSLWRRRLAHQLGDTWQAPTQTTRYLFSLLRDLAGVPSRDAARLSCVEASAITAPPEALADFYSFPEWIAEVLLTFGGEAPALADALNLPGPVFLRVNNLKTSAAALQKQLASEGVESEFCVYAKDALRVTSPQPNIYGLACYQRGEFEVQDEGSQLLALLVEARPGQTIIDYCAGAGGKTLALASQLNDQGALFAYDVDPQRLARLALRARSAGAACLKVETSAEALPMADAVLVDAPCSELGALRRGPDMRWRLQDGPQWPTLQLEILQRAQALVRPGGRLVYATCTLRREENQGVVARFLEANKNFQLAPLPVYSTFGQTTPHHAGSYFVSLPHRHKTDGFFAAVLQKE